jgi:hypothetical protein
MPTMGRSLSSTLLKGMRAMPPVNPITQNRPSNLSARSAGSDFPAHDVVDHVDTLAVRELPGRPCRRRERECTATLPCGGVLPEHDPARALSGAGWFLNT